MKFLLKFGKTIKNNPKKSVFGGVVAYFAGKWINGKYSDSCFREDLCRKAQVYGEETVSALQEPKRITVFLNPAANGGKAMDMFYKNAAPVLHLAGLEVHVVVLEHEGQAKKLLQVLDKTDMIVAAGGDGTLNEVVTGLLRKTDCKRWKKVPIAVIPLGKHNVICRNLCNNSNPERQAQWICDSAFDIIHAVTKPVDVMRVETNEGNTVYCLSDIRWGIYRDIYAKIEKYWYWASLKPYAAFFFAWTKSKTFKLRDFTLSYLDPVEIVEEIEEKEDIKIKNLNASNMLMSRLFSRLFSWFWSSEVENEKVKVISNMVEVEDQAVEINEDEKWTTQDFTSYEIMASANRCHQPNREKAFIEIKTEEPNVNFKEFVTQGPFLLHHGVHKEIHPQTNLQVSKFKFTPNLDNFGETVKDISYFSIDNESYDAKPISVEVLPNYINLVCSNKLLPS